MRIWKFLSIASALAIAGLVSAQVRDASPSQPDHGVRCPVGISEARCGDSVGPASGDGWSFPTPTIITPPPAPPVITPPDGEVIVPPDPSPQPQPELACMCPGMAWHHSGGFITALGGVNYISYTDCEAARGNNPYYMCDYSTPRMMEPHQQCWSIVEVRPYIGQHQQCW